MLYIYRVIFTLPIRYNTFYQPTVSCYCKYPDIRVIIYDVYDLTKQNGHNPVWNVKELMRRCIIKHFFSLSHIISFVLYSRSVILGFKCIWVNDSTTKLKALKVPNAFVVFKRQHKYLDRYNVWRIKWEIGPSRRRYRNIYYINIYYCILL